MNLRKRVDRTTGRVRIYDTYSKTWVHKLPIDAKEMIAVGSGSLEGPTIAMMSPAGKVMVVDSEVDAKLADGWTLVEDQERPGEAANPGDKMSQEERDAMTARDEAVKAQEELKTALAKHTVDELRAITASLDLEGCNGLKKSELIDKLVEAGYQIA